MINTFDSIRRFNVPAEIADSTDVQLREAGRAGVERFVLWSGVIDGSEFHVRTLHVPKQIAYRLPEGLCVRVDGEELHRLNVWLYEHGERLGIQVHSHPTDAYHSDTDDEYPIVTTQGGLSLVVPDFGQAGVRGPRTALYRLKQTGWQGIVPAASRTLLHF